MRNRLFVLCAALFVVAPASAEMNVGIGFPNVSIGITLPFYPDFEPVPGYPVYYAPRLDANYFFYDGLYWVFQDDSWFVSTWYNGPWQVVNPEYVPDYVLRVPVRYYRQPPRFFIGWQQHLPPLWGQYWGSDWSQRRSGWDHWNHAAVPKPAPLPVYQRKYSGGRYPGADQQHTLHGRNYRYQPLDPVVRQYVKTPRTEAAPAQPQHTQPRPIQAPRKANQEQSRQPRQPAEHQPEPKPNRQRVVPRHDSVPTTSERKQRTEQEHEQERAER